MNRDLFFPGARDIEKSIHTGEGLCFLILHQTSAPSKVPGRQSAPASACKQTDESTPLPALSMTSGWAAVGLCPQGGWAACTEMPRDVGSYQLLSSCGTLQKALEMAFMGSARTWVVSSRRQAGSLDLLLDVSRWS